MLNSVSLNDTYHLMPFLVTLDVFDFAIKNDSNTDFAKILENNMRATQSLVTRLAEINGDSRSRVGQEDAFRQCQEVTSEVRSSRSYSS